MDSDIKLQDDGTVEVIGNGGYLSVGDGNVELGSSDSGTFKGFSLGQDGTVQLLGDSFGIGHLSSGGFQGLTLQPGGIANLCCSGLWLWSPDVEMTGSQPAVALQQTIYNELLINANGGYQGGVRFDGSVHLSGDLSVQTNLQMQVGSKLLLMQPDVKRHAPKGKVFVIPQPPIDVLETIQSLMERIQKLEDRVAALEAK
jgi:hypothetical protein